MWALGVLLYEMYLCRSPFKPKNHIGTNNQKFALMRKKILKKEPLDMELIPSGPRDLISQLLKKDPNERINALDIISHPWIKFMR